MLEDVQNLCPLLCIESHLLLSPCHLSTSSSYAHSTFNHCYSESQRAHFGLWRVGHAASVAPSRSAQVRVIVALYPLNKVKQLLHDVHMAPLLDVRFEFPTGDGCPFEQEHWLTVPLQVLVSSDYPALHEAQVAAQFLMRAAHVAGRLLSHVHCE